MTAYLAGVQERLRAAELARVEAQAEAAEERKRRRLTVALAASVLVIAGAGRRRLGLPGAAAAGAGGGFNRAVGEAEARTPRPGRVGDDLARWLAARDAAHALEGLLADAPDDQTRNRVSGLVREVTEAAAHAERRPEAAGEAGGHPLGQGRRSDGSATDAAYADAFREAGIDLDVLGPPRTAGRGSRPGRRGRLGPGCGPG